MSIIIFSNTLRGTSGLQKSLIETANLFASRQHDVHIINIAGNRPGVLEATPQIDLDDDVKLYALASYTDDDVTKFHLMMKAGYEIDQEFLKAKFTKYDLYALNSIFRKITKDDRVIFTHPLQAALYKASGAFTDAPKILQMHGNYLDERHNLELLLECQDVIDALQVVTPAMIEGLAKVTRFCRDSMFYIPNIHRPIEIETNKNSKNVAIIGSLQDRKGQFDALKAFQYVRHPDAKLHIWGGNRGEYYKGLQSYVEAAELNDRVVFCGSGSEREIYKDTGLVIMTSRSEGMSYIHLESASHRIPQICYSFNYGPSDFIADGETGYIVSYGDYRTLARKIDELLEDDAKRKSFGEKAHEKFKSEYSVDAIYDLYCEKFGFNKADIENRANALIPQKPHRDIGHLSLKEFKWKRRSLFRRDSCIQNIALHTPSLSDGVYNFSLCFDNKVVNHSAQVINGKINLNIREVPLMKSGYPKKYIAYIIKDGIYHYLFNTTLKGRAEINGELNSSFPSYNEVFIGDVFHLFSTNGLNLAMPSSEIVRQLTNECDRDIPFSVRPITIDGVRYPSISGVRSEYKNIYIRGNHKNAALIRFPRKSYQEIWEEVDALEQKYGLCEYAVGDVLPWQIVKPVIIDALMEFHGNWGALFRNPSTINLEYRGTKKLSQIQDGSRLLFSSARKRGNLSSNIADAMIDDNSVVIEHPQANGYSLECYDLTSNTFPIAEFLHARDKGKLPTYPKYVDDIFERIFFESFNANINFPVIINGRIEKYIKEYQWWSSFFETRQFDEVLIPSAFWFPGIVKAVKDAGIPTSDLQYAMISPFHPNYGFATRKEYTTDRIYLWSPYWDIKELPYDERRYLPSHWANTYLERSAGSSDSQFDVAVISQTRLSDSIIDWIKNFSRSHPQYRIVYSMHPDEDKRYISDQLRGSRVEVGSERTIDILRRSKAAIGVYSTALYEAAYLGLPVYILDLPGHEIMAREINSGMFSLLGESETAEIDIDSRPHYPNFFSR